MNGISGYQDSYGGGKRPRIQFKTLQLSKEKGGRSLPCLTDYYKAAQLRPLACCCNPVYIAKWKDLETSQLDIPLQSILGSKTLYGQHVKSLNQWTKVPLRIWFKECRSPLLDCWDGSLLTRTLGRRGLMGGLNIGIELASLLTVQFYQRENWIVFRTFQRSMV